MLLMIRLKFWGGGPERYSALLITSCWHFNRTYHGFRSLCSPGPGRGCRVSPGWSYSFSYIPLHPLLSGGKLLCTAPHAGWDLGSPPCEWNMYINYLEFFCLSDSCLLPHLPIYISIDSQVGDMSVLRCETSHSGTRPFCPTHCIVGSQADQPSPGKYVRILLSPA